MEIKMRSTAEKQIVVETIVDEFVNKGLMFTAFDVTKEARKRNIDDNHYNLKNYIHKMFQELSTRGYSRSLFVFPNNTSAWVYHPSSKDYIEYDPNAIHQEENISTAQSNMQFVTNFQKKTVDYEHRFVDNNNRLLISRKFIKQLNANPGDKIYISQEKNLSLILSLDYNYSYPICHYSVNADGRVRIGYKILKSANIHNCSTGYEISFDNNKILIFKKH